MTTRNPHRFFLAACSTSVCIAVCVAGRPSLAQEDSSSTNAASQKRALEALKRGIAEFENGDFGQAIVAFRESYQAYPTAVASFNLAESYIRQAQIVLDVEMLDLAEQALNLAVSDEPKVPLDESRLARIEELRTSIDTLREELGCRRETILYEESLKRWQTARAVCKEKTEDVRLEALGKTGIGVAAAGGIVLLVSGWYGIQASREYEALQPPHRDGRAAYDVAVEEFEQTKRRGRGTLYAGGGLFLVGAAMTLVDALSERTVYAEPGCEEIMTRPAPPEPACMSTTTAWWRAPTPLHEVSSSTRFEVQAGPGFLSGTLRF